MAQLPKIADAEMEIMNALWTASPLTASEIVAALEKRKSWDPRTVKTLINRLHNKGAIGFEKSGRKYSYFPLVPRDECIRNETRSFISKFKNGMLGPVLTTFLEEAALSEKEIGELRQMLEEKGTG